MNLEFIQENFWAMKDLSATDNLADPVWREKASGLWTDCCHAAEALPQETLDNCPVTRMFGPLGRFIKFLQCKKVSSAGFWP